jgi:hypothetical protein
LFGGAEFVDAFLDLVGGGGDGFGGFEVGNGFFGVAGLLFDEGEVPGDLKEEKSVRVFLGAFGLAPVFQGGFPEVAGAVGVFVAFVVDAAEFEKDSVAARVGCEAFAQKRFGLLEFAHAGAEPIGADGVGFDAVGVHGSGHAEPGKHFANFLFAVVQMVAAMVFVKVGVSGGIERTAESIDEVERFAEEIVVFTLFVVSGDSVGIGRDMGVVAVGFFVEDGGVIAAVEIDVSFDEEMGGEETAGVAEDDFDGSFLVTKVRFGGGKLGLDRDSESEERSSR